MRNITNIEYEEGYLILVDGNGLRTKVPIAPLVVVEYGTPVNAVASSLTTELIGDNNDLVFEAKTKGVAGDLITIQYVDPGEASQELSIEVIGTAIVVNLATDGDSLITTTSGDIIIAIEGDVDAAALVSVVNSGEDNGAGVVTEMEATALSGGVDGTVATQGKSFIDATYIYYAVSDNTIADTNWRRVSLGSAY